MNAQICVVRHGETDWNAAGVLQGWIDVPINGTGRAQARALAGDFASCGFARVYCSPLARAQETAAIIAAELALALPQVHEGLKERNFGSVQGVPKAEIAEKRPEVHRHIVERNPAGHFADGETMLDFHARVLAAVAEIGAAHAGQCVLIVTHGWVMDVVTRHVEGHPASAILPIKRKNGESIWLMAGPAGIVGCPPP